RSLELPPEHAGPRLSRGALAALWFAALAGPHAWGLQLEALYMASAWTCAHGGILVLHATSGFCLLVAVSASWVGFRHRDGRIPAPELLARVGWMSGALFGLVIAAQWTALFFLTPCPA